MWLNDAGVAYAYCLYCTILSDTLTLNTNSPSSLLYIYYCKTRVERTRKIYPSLDWHNTTRSIEKRTKVCKNHPSVLIMVKDVKGAVNPGRIGNLDEVMDSLKNAFPLSSIRRVSWKGVPLEDQVHLMMQTGALHLKE